jgi:hypothetical protein
MQREMNLNFESGNIATQAIQTLKEKFTVEVQVDPN